MGPLNESRCALGACKKAEPGGVCPENPSIFGQ